VSVDGEVLGEHKGAYLYTPGQGARIGGAQVSYGKGIQLTLYGHAVYSTAVSLLVILTNSCSKFIAVKVLI